MVEDERTSWNPLFETQAYALLQRDSDNWVAVRKGRKKPLLSFKQTVGGYLYKSLFK